MTNLIPDPNKFIALLVNATLILVRGYGGVEPAAVTQAPDEPEQASLFGRMRYDGANLQFSLDANADFDLVYVRVFDDQMNVLAQLTVPTDDDLPLPVILGQKLDLSIPLQIYTVDPGELPVDDPEDPLNPAPEPEYPEEETPLESPPPEHPDQLAIAGVDANAAPPMVEE